MFRKMIAMTLCLVLVLSLAPAALAIRGGAGGASGGMGGGSAGHYTEAVELFEQYEYTDEATGLTIPYNLYLPEGYADGEETYPLVIFIADSSVNSNDVTAPLNQDGAAVWATAQEQAKHPCIVLVPQYTTDLVNEIGMMTTDDNVWTDGLTLAKSLMDYIITEYRVDESRIYGTGQSQGGMAAIAISDRYPDFYTAQYLVACQWDVEEMAAMVDDKLWIVVCEGDTKAYPGMNGATALWADMGADVATDELWDSTSDADAFAALVEGMRAQDCAINYNVFEGGNHMYTWTVAYTIEGIRDWLFEQVK